MSLYDVDFDQLARDYYPTHKRLTNLLGVQYSFLKPLNDANLFFKYFREGGTFTAYSGATTYTYGQYVQYQRRVYYRNEVTDGYTSGITPVNTTYWVKILNSFIGSNERLKFGPSKLVYEYALNKIFGTVFRQPSVGTSDIYITDLNTEDDTFYVGELDTDTAQVSETDQTALFFVPENDPSGGESDYAINVPIAVYNALAATNVERDAIITSVANVYRLVGYNFDIVTY